LRGVLDDLYEGEEPDDNGSDPVRTRRRSGSGHHVSEAGEHGAHGSIPNVHGGGSAGHR
jgi:hypothetical protein